MRRRYDRLNCVFHFLGNLLVRASMIILLPLILVFLFWGRYNEGWSTLFAFVASAALCAIAGIVLRSLFNRRPVDTTSSMLICAVSWIAISAIGAIPYVFGIGANYLDAYFEAISGFTTTGITMFTGLDEMPRSILFWRGLTQWLGGLGILSLFLAVTFRGGGFHYIYSAESHKISASRPTPGLYNTLKILWSVYGLFTGLAILFYTLAGMPVFDSICHALTTLSTGGFSPHDASIAYYRLNNYPHYRAIEYITTFFMLLGGINFLIHYRVLKRNFKALWDNAEIRLWWQLFFSFVVFIMLNHIFRVQGLSQFLSQGCIDLLNNVEQNFRFTIFQVTSILTTTGFGTQDINTAFFPALAKQLFLVMMVIGGCVGSTGGGIKVIRIKVLGKLMAREIFKLRISRRASRKLVIDGKLIPDDEIHRISALFFFWILLLVLGGGITALLSDQNAWQSLSGMFSALGNIGPCYISVQDMIQIHPAVKLTYILGMLAGRLEIIPMLLIFSRKAWQNL